MHEHNLSDPLLANLLDRPRRWLLPAALVAVTACVYAAFGGSTWEASQALMVRAEAANGQLSPGKFNGLDEMKIVEETILELARTRGVLEAAWTSVEGLKPGDSPTPPTAEQLEDLKGRVKLAAPKGSEFGKTEVFYLKVRDRNRARAVALADAICQQLQSRFQELRNAKAQSMIDELTKAANLTKADLADSTSRLNQLERKAGINLAELRVLQESSAGESALRRTYTEVCNELRQAQVALQTDRELLGVLHAAQADPARLLATPSRLLESQPLLRRLKEGLVDNQLREAQYQGRMVDAHPLVQAARESQREIARQLHNELGLAVRALEVDLRVHGERLAMLNAQLATLTSQMTDVAAVRAQYSNLVAEVRSREGLVQRAEQNLAEARACQASAKASSLIARIDSADTGAKPVGPSPAMLALGGLVGGLLVGLGMVVLTTPSSPLGHTFGPTLYRPTDAPHGLSLKGHRR
jgi:uncharacterized protein involved in exopolysaccharide biosynthesis